MIVKKLTALKIGFFNSWQKISYVLINILMAILSFAKSYLIMRYLGFYEVGLLAMLMSVMEFVSMLQLGLLNGGFRMYFINPGSIRSKINNMLFSYFGLLLIIILAVSVLYGLIVGFSFRSMVIALGASVGVVTLSKTWISNLLIAGQKLTMLNRINIWSNLLSFLFVVLIPFLDTAGAILLIISQPIIFTVSALWINPDLRPTQMQYKKSLLRKLVYFGFVPFLAGILVKLDDQIERWGIINLLGLEQLGKYNLVIIYCSLFMLVPASLNPIFYPKAMIQFREGDFSQLNKTIKYYILALSVYSIVAICSTIFLLPYFVNLLLPKYNIGVPYVWYIIPYLLAQMIIMPVDFIYTITAKYKVMFVSYSFAVLLFAGLVIGISLMQIKRLEYFAIAKSIDGAAFIVISYFGYYIFVRKKIFRNGLDSKD